MRIENKQRSERDTSKLAEKVVSEREKNCKIEGDIFSIEIEREREK